MFDKLDEVVFGVVVHLAHKDQVSGCQGVDEFVKGEDVPGIQPDNPPDAVMS